MATKFCGSHFFRSETTSWSLRQTGVPRQGDVGLMVRKVTAELIEQLAELQEHTDSRNRKCIPKAGALAVIGCQLRLV